MPELYEDKSENNEDKKDKKPKIEKNEEENKNENNILKNKINYSTITTKNKNKNLRRDKKLNTEMNVKKARFIDNSKPNNNYNYYNYNTEPKYEVITTIDHGLTEEYKKKNNVKIENINNKEKLVINEYPLNEKDKKKLKKYKTEYIWDKNINRLVEKRIYFDKDDEPINDTKKNKNILNEDNIKNKEEIYKNEEKEEKSEPQPEFEENLEKIKVNLKFKKIDDDNKKKESKNKKIEIRKRFGNSQLIYKKDKKEEKIDNNKVNNNIENQNKELNRSYRYHRIIKNYNVVEKPNKE